MIGICEHCGRPLSAEGGIELCLFCNQIATPQDHLIAEKTVIECPGATLYDVETGRVLRGVKFYDLDDESDPVTKAARDRGAKAWKEDAETSPSVLYVRHEQWMESKANLGVQISHDDEDIIYEQDNFAHLRER